MAYSLESELARKSEVVRSLESQFAQQLADIKVPETLPATLGIRLRRMYELTSSATNRDKCWKELTGWQPSYADHYRAAKIPWGVVRAIADKFDLRPIVNDPEFIRLFESTFDPETRRAYSDDETNAFVYEGHVVLGNVETTLVLHVFAFAGRPWCWRFWLIRHKDQRVFGMPPKGRTGGRLRATLWRESVPLLMSDLEYAIAKASGGE